MALITKIRKQSGLLITLIALALISFVIMDMTNSKSGILSGSTNSVGKINGKKVDYTDFQNVEQILYGNDKGDPFARRSSIWNYFVDETILAEEAEDTGLGVGKEELEELQFGTNLSPIIEQRFGDPNTRQVDRARLAQFKEAIKTNKLPAEVKPYWAHQQKEIVTDRIQSKLSAIVAKGLYTPTWQAEMQYNDQASQMAFNYVKVPFEVVQDAEVKVEDSDYKAYLDENKAIFKQDEETRKVGFISFDVKPTTEDSIKIADDISKLIEGLRTAENDSLYIVNNYGAYDGLFHKKDELPAMVKDTAFDLGVGTIFGPFLDGNDFRIMKIMDKRVVADSVKSRHILIKADQNNPAGLAAAEKTIDSLKNLVETGVASFDSLAMKFGQDGTNVKGGDLGYAALNGMVKPFNDLIFFKAEKGKIYKVTTQFGVHLVEMLDKKISNNTAIKVAFLSQPNVPSEATQNAMLEKAQNIVAQNRTYAELEAYAKKSDLPFQVSPGLKQNDFVVGALGQGNTSRDIVRWAFGDEAKVNGVSSNVYAYQAQDSYFDNKYVVVALKNIQPAGIPSVENVKDEIEAIVKNRKKGEVIKKKIANAKDLNAIAAQFAMPVDTANAVSFSSPFVPGLGNEPKVVATAYGMKDQAVSEALVGNAGVFVVKMNSKQAAPPAGDLTFLKKQGAMAAQMQVQGRLMASLRKKADISDNRNTFF